jgi:hypothetical protein
LEFHTARNARDIWLAIKQNATMMRAMSFFGIETEFWSKKLEEAGADLDSYMRAVNTKQANGQSHSDIYRSYYERDVEK